MPTIRKLQEEDIRPQVTKEESERTKVAREYDGYLADFSPNELGEAGFDEESESRLTVKNRLQAAAKRRGLTLAFIRSAGPVVRFRVKEGEPASPAPTRAKRGRKAAQE